MCATDGTDTTVLFHREDSVLEGTRTPVIVVKGLTVGYDDNTALFADCDVPGYLEVEAQTPLTPASLLARARTDVKATFVEDREFRDSYGALRLHREASITIHFVRRR